MSKKNTTKQFYLDRDTDLKTTLLMIGQWFKTIVYEFLKERLADLQEETAGGFRTITISVKIENKELTKMHAFFRGAVVMYYYRQSRENFDEEYKLNAEDMKVAVDEIKNETKFFVHDEDGEVIGLNTFAVFENTKKFTEKINEVENIMFDDNGYLFPDSEEYKVDYAKYGRLKADMRALTKLIEWNDKQYKKE